MKNILKRFLALILIASFTSIATSGVSVYAENDNVDIADEQEDYIDDELSEIPGNIEDSINDDIVGDVTEDIALETTDNELQNEELTSVNESVDEIGELVDTIPEKSKVLSERCGKQYQFLRNFAIIEEDYEADKMVTRGEFAAILTRMLGVTNGNTKIFKDVFTRTANSKAIGIVTEYGLMEADKDGYFRPKDPLTIEVAAKAFFTLAGYDSVIDTYGGEKEGYMRLAAQDGWVSPNPDGSMTWETTAEVIYKAMYIDVISIDTISGISATYEKSSTKLLGMLYGLKEAKGRIMANGYAAARGRDITDVDEVVINTSAGDWTYFVGNTDISKHLGYSVTFFYYEDDIKDYTIAAYMINDNKTSVLEIKERDFHDVNRALTQLQYLKDSKLKSVKLENDAVMIYNGAMEYDVTKLDFDAADIITLIDTDNNGSYDICKITSYDYYLVSYVSPEHSVISDKREGMSLTIDDDKYDVSITKYGYAVELDKIEEWDILSVEVTKPGSVADVMNISVSNGVDSGKVETKNLEERTIEIDGTEYYVSKSVNMNDMFGEIIFGLDEDMKIICFMKDTNTERNYGYIVKFFKEYDQNMEERINIYFMDDTGSFVTLPLAERFVINGKRSTWDDLCNLIGKNGDPARERDKAKEQIFAYMLDASGAVKRLYFAIDSQGRELQSGAVEAAKDNELVLNKKFSSTRVWDRSGLINGEYIYTGDTTCFSVVTDASGEIIEELSGIFTMGQMRFSSGSRVANGARPTELYCYDAGVSRKCRALLSRITFDNINNFSGEMTQVLVVDKVKTVLNIDDEIVDQVEGYYAGSYMKFYVDDRRSIDLSTWEKGDIFSIRLSVKGRLLTATKLFSMHDASVLSPKRSFSGAQPAITVGSTYSPTTVVNAFAESMNNVYGTIKAVDATSVRIRPEGGTEDLIFKFSGTFVYIYDTDSNTIEMSNVDGFTNGMGTGKAFIYARNGFARDIFVIK